MALYVTRPRRDEEQIGRGLPSASAQLVEQLCSCNSPYVVDNLFCWIINKIKITLWIFRFCKGRELYINQKGSQRDVAHCAQIPLKLK